MSAKVKKLIEKLAHNGGQDWQKATNGWEAIETTLRLSGWTRQRRIVVLRRPLSQRRAKCREANDWLSGLAMDEGSIPWEYSALVCREDLGLESLPRLYAERTDCENLLDELKNQWGLG